MPNTHRESLCTNVQTLYSVPVIETEYISCFGVKDRIYILLKYRVADGLLYYEVLRGGEVFQGYR